MNETRPSMKNESMIMIIMMTSSNLSELYEKVFTRIFLARQGRYAHPVLLPLIKRTVVVGGLLSLGRERVVAMVVRLLEFGEV